MRPAAPAASGRSRCRSSQRRREVVPTDWEGLHPPPWWREIGATLAVRWHRRKMPTATVGTKRRRQLVPVDSTISPPPPRDPPRWTRWGRWRAISAAAMARKLSQSGREGAARLSPPTQPPRSSRHAVVWASRLRMCLILVHADLEVTGVVAQFRVLAALQSHEHRSNDQTRASAHFGRCISKYMLPLARESI